MDYISASHIADDNQHNNSFFRGFPSVVKHALAVSKEMAKLNLKKICKCGSICHEWDNGLMHTHMDIVKRIFLEAINSYWENRKSVVMASTVNTADTAVNKTSSGDYLDLNKAKKSYVGRNGTIYSVEKHQLLSGIDGGIFSKRSTAMVQGSGKPEGKEGTVHSFPFAVTTLPVIPDVAIHYRCGDNLFTHYGFTPFRIFAKIIPTTAKHIYILSESSDRSSKLNSVTRCAAIFDALHIYLMKHFPSSVVVILRGHDIFEVGRDFHVFFSSAIFMSVLVLLIVHRTSVIL